MLSFEILMKDSYRELFFFIVQYVCSFYVRVPEVTSFGSLRRNHNIPKWKEKPKNGIEIPGKTHMWHEISGIFFVLWISTYFYVFEQQFTFLFIICENLDRYNTLLLVRNLQYFFQYVIFLVLYDFFICLYNIYCKQSWHFIYTPATGSLHRKYFTFLWHV